MYFGVRLAGASWLHAPLSWGFGQRKKPKDQENKEGRDEEKGKDEK